MAVEVLCFRVVAVPPPLASWRIVGNRTLQLQRRITCSHIVTKPSRKRRLYYSQSGHYCYTVKVVIIASLHMHCRCFTLLMISATAETVWRFHCHQYLCHYCQYRNRGSWTEVYLLCCLRPRLLTPQAGSFLPCSSIFLEVRCTATACVYVAVSAPMPSGKWKESRGCAYFRAQSSIK